METDFLQEIWETQSKVQLRTSKEKIMQIIHYKKYGPLDSLKNKFLWKILKFPIILLIILVGFFKIPGLKNDILPWFFLVFSFLTSGFYLFNYLKVKEIIKGDKTIKYLLEKNLTVLERSFKIYILISGCINVLLTILLEALLFFHKVSFLESWYSVPFFIRFAIYVTFIYLNLFFLKKFFRKKFGKDISDLGELLRMMM